MRADVFLVSHAHARSREAAKRLIEAGRVSIDGVKVAKAAADVDENTAHEVSVIETDEFVSRGGYKLEAALDAFGISVAGMRAVDIGASTGGFTDCLLRRGASAVYAADSGHDQLDAALREDARVVNIEGFNARRLCEGERGGIEAGLDIAVMDVSFISQTYILPGIPNVLREGGVLISLIKPQFEAGRGAVGKGGIVKHKQDRLAAVRRVMDCAAASGFGYIGLITSPITGGDGNVEYLLAARCGGGTDFPDARDIQKLI
ncbi:MAG: TlyA family RNA methyltransferase [Clostridia bacterium]|nr:TlyA family RNA methyltransferase [Clostridia bacterium]